MGYKSGLILQDERILVDLYPRRSKAAANMGGMQGYNERPVVEP